MIHLINHPGCIVLPPGVDKDFQIRKNSKKRQICIDKNISDLIIECFDRHKSCQKWYFEQLISRWKIPIWQSSPSGSLQSLPHSQIWWFLNLIQWFPIARYTVLVEIEVVRNYVINNFKGRDQHSRIHSFHSKSLYSLQNSAILWKNRFLVYFIGS